MVDIKKPTPTLYFRNPLVPLKKVEKTVLHHMAHRTAGIHDVHNWHRNRTYVTISGRTAYWSGIGYNYWIGFDGTIYEGRGLHVGAHTLGWNDRSIGIGFQGDLEEQEMTDEQLDAGAALCRKLLNDYSLSVMDIIGHKDLTETLCPGKNFRMGELKELITLIDDSIPEAEVLYTVQVGAFRYRHNAERLRDTLRKWGYYDAFITIKNVWYKN